MVMRLKDIIMYIYEVVWSRIGGRPWTYIIRDSYHKRPVLWIVGFLIGGTVVGTILGHIFW